MARPNILFILADDLGYADLSSYGRRDYETPHLDALAKRGIKLTHGYSNSPVCSATRVSLITGQYQYRYPLGLHEPVAEVAPGLNANSPEERGKRFVPLPTDIKTLPGEFKKRGYSTHLVGKWHLGKLPDNGPRSYGYDTFFGFLGGAADYFSHRMHLAEPREQDGLVVNDEFVEREGYLTTLLGDETDKLIKERKDRDPWFLSLHFNAPHWPWEGPNDAEASKDLKSLFTSEGNIQKYGEIVKAMDDQIGRLVDTLKKTEQFDNTIIVFTSDNGGERFSDNWPFIGVKTELLEGGLRVPVILSWPRGFHATSGRESSQVLTSMDFFATLLGLVDDSGHEYEGTDGKNLSQVLTGKKAEVKRTLYWRYKAHEQKAVLDGDWKYLKIGQKEHLFNLTLDERERTDYKQKHPEIFKALKLDWERWNEQMLPYPEHSFSYNVKPEFADRY